jgi:hypothetical protein
MIFEAIRSGAWAALSNKAKAIYAVISYFVQEDGGQCSMRRLARYSGVSKFRTIEAVEELIAAGLILCHKGDYVKPSQFQLLSPRVTLVVDQRPLCLYCGRPSVALDHVIPRSKGGCSNPANLVPCCFRCNTLKGALSYQEFLSVTERLMWAERETELDRVGPEAKTRASPRRMAKSCKIRLTSKPHEIPNAG